VVIESIYSMDGDEAPIKKIATLCEKYQVALIVDEAHAAGIFGDRGEGLVHHYQLQNKVFARIITFGKAYGCHGAAILSNVDVRNYLINFSKPFIYTTALPLLNILAIKKAHEFLDENLEIKDKLKEWVAYFRLQIGDKHSLIPSNSPIQCVIIPGNNKVKQLAQKIQNDGLDVRPILSPTVPKNTERLRICLHTFNTKQQINRLIMQLNE